MAQELQPGEHVAWSYGAGQAKGHVVEKLTENKKLGSRVFKASPDDPKYLVKSDASGKEAIKKPETLHKIEEDMFGADDSTPSSKDGQHTSDEGDASRQEVGAKEKRDGFQQRSSKEDRKETAQCEEGVRKAADTGMGSARASARAAKGKLKEVAEVLGEATEEGGAQMDEEGERKDKSYEPKKAEMETVDADDEGPVDVPEVMAQVEEEAKEEGIRNVSDAGGVVKDGEQDKEDQPVKAE